MLRQIKQLVPLSVKHNVKEALQERRLRRALRGISDLPEGQQPSRELLFELQAGWRNDSFAARFDYLEEVIKRARETSGPILECGSGLSTLLLGLFAGRRGVQTWSLEHLPEWHARVTKAIHRHQIPGVNVCLAPLREYGEFDWYDLPREAMPDSFSLIVCDGPPGMTRGGRYGLMPVLEKRIGANTLILLDDADREDETAILRRWSLETNVKVNLRATPTGSFALVHP
ncbi:MAG TPA: hypothetical protein VIF81_13490 [Pyrinomonadaceae bacterium]|jgi:hypothetical protein